MDAPFKPQDPFKLLPQEEQDYFNLLRRRDGIQEVRPLIEENPHLINKKNSSGRTVLMQAAMIDDTDLIIWLLKRGATLEEKDDMGRTAFGWAAASRQLTAATLLFSHGADVNNVSGNAMHTPLMLAAIYGYVEVISFLLENGADLHAKQYQGLTALDLAEQHGKSAAAELLKNEIEKRAREKRAREAAKHAQWIKETDCTSGLQKPVRAVRSLKIRRTP